MMMEELQQLKNFENAVGNYRNAVNSIDIDKLCKWLEKRGFSDKDIAICRNVYRDSKEFLKVV